MKFWELAICFLKYDSRLFLGVLTGLLILGSAQSLADVLHFYDGKIARGKLVSVTGDLIEFKTSFFRAQRLKRMNLSNRHDVVETRSYEKIFGEVTYADATTLEIITSKGRAKVPRLFIKNIVLGALEQPTVEAPAAPAHSLFPTTPAATTPTASVTMPAAPSAVPAQPSTRIPLQEQRPTVLFPPFNTPSEDRDAINTDDRLP